MTALVEAGQVGAFAVWVAASHSHPHLQAWESFKARQQLPSCHCCNWNRGSKAPRPPLARSGAVSCSKLFLSSFSPPHQQYSSASLTLPIKLIPPKKQFKMVKAGMDHSSLCRGKLWEQSFLYNPQSRRMRHCCRPEGFRAHLSGFPSRWMTRCHSTIP
jgi:hypothetical protein